MNSKKPNLIFNRTIWKYIFIAWVAIWISVFFKNLLCKGYLKEYLELSARHTLDEKRSFVTGDRLYKFILFCKGSIPNGATFEYAGIKDNSIEDRRVRYYLCPNLKSRKADYLLVYDAPFDSSSGEWVIYKRLDKKRFILKRSR